jgi:hypothetical protein
MPFRTPLGAFFIRPTGELGWFMLLSLKREVDRDAKHIRNCRLGYWVGGAAGNRLICDAGCAHSRPANEHMVDLATMIHKNSCMAGDWRQRRHQRRYVIQPQRVGPSRTRLLRFGMYRV